MHGSYAMKRTLIPVLIAIALVSAGCAGRIAKEVVLPAKGLSVPISPATVKPVKFAKVEVADFTNTGITTMPPNMNALLRAEVALRIAKLDPDKSILSPGTPGVLLVRGRYLYYEEASGAMAQLLGPFEEIIALVELVDKSTNKVLATGYCVGRTNTLMTQGPKDKAEGLAKAIIELIRKSCKT